MANVTASMVKSLREATSAGMMDCKKALVESQGDMEAAKDWLRKKGLNKAAKAASRVAAEGVILAATKEGQGVMVEVNCETDFVSRDESFQAFCQLLLDAAVQWDGDDVAALMASNDNALENARQTLVAKIGENIQVRRMVSIAKTDNALGTYVHMGRIGAIVELSDADADLAKNLAMHVAATAPEFMDISEIPAERYEKERQFLVEQAAQSGKPAEIIAKMVEGRLNKAFADLCLLTQPYFRDPDMTIEKLLKQHKAAVVRFERFLVGEGIEKEEKSFAEEVQAQIKGNQ